MKNVKWIFGLRKNDLYELDYLDVKLLNDGAKDYRDMVRDEVKQLRKTRMKLAYNRNIRQRYYLSLTCKTLEKKLRHTLVAYRLMQRDSLIAQAAFLDQCKAKSWRMVA